MDDTEQLRVGNRAVQAVGAEQELVAGLNVNRSDVRAFANFLTAEVFPQDVAEAMLLGLGGGDRLVFDKRLGERVIDRQLFDLVIANEVGAAVAQTGDEKLRAAAPQRHDDRRAHVLEVAVERAHGDDFIVGLNDGLLDDGAALVVIGAGGEVLTQLARHDLDGAFAGDLAGCLTAHAVRDDADRHIRILLGLDGVFVVFAIVPKQRAFADVERQGHEPTSCAIGPMRPVKPRETVPRWVQTTMISDRAP